MGSAQLLNLPIHRTQEFVIAASPLHVLEQELHRLFRLHVVEVIAQDEHALERVLVEQQVVAAGAGIGEVHCRIEAPVGKVAVEL